MNMKTIEKEKTIETIKVAASQPATNIRVWRDGYEVGHGKDQGDLLMWVSDVDVSKLERVKANGSFQLAPGNTQGSRHTIDSSQCKIYKGPNFGKFINKGTREKPAGYIEGYIIVTDNALLVEHPEHPHHLLPGGCTIQTAGQSDARTLQWAKD